MASLGELREIGDAGAVWPLVDGIGHIKFTPQLSRVDDKRLDALSTAKATTAGATCSPSMNSRYVAQRPTYRITLCNRDIMPLDRCPPHRPAVHRMPQRRSRPARPFAVRPRRRPADPKQKHRTVPCHRLGRAGVGRQVHLYRQGGRTLLRPDYI